VKFMSNELGEEGVALLQKALSQISNKKVAECEKPENKKKQEAKFDR